VIVGIDQGTTGTRACAVDEEGDVVAQSYRPHAQIHPRPGWVEHDAEEIWHNVEEVLGEVRAGSEVMGIGLAHQGETVLAWDRKTGKPLHNAIVWQDARTIDTCEELALDVGFAKRVTEKTGLRIDPYFSASAQILRRFERAVRRVTEDT
jgi:glycerol kinase